MRGSCFSFRHSLAVRDSSKKSGLSSKEEGMSPDDRGAGCSFEPAMLACYQGEVRSEVELDVRCEEGAANCSFDGTAR